MAYRQFNLLINFIGLTNVTTDMGLFILLLVLSFRGNFCTLIMGVKRTLKLWRRVILAALEKS